MVNYINYILKKKLPDNAWFLKIEYNLSKIMRTVNLFGVLLLNSSGDASTARVNLFLIKSNTDFTLTIGSF